MNRLLLVAAFSMLALPALAETVGEKSGINSALGVAPTTKDFVTEAASSDMYEIRSSKLASAKLNGPEKQFAEHMIADHTKTTAELTQLAQGDNIALPKEMSSSQQKMIDKLNGLSGDDFRKEYVNEQITAHKDAVSLFDRYGKGGDNTRLKAWAMKTRPALANHLEMVQGLYKKS